MRKIRAFPKVSISVLALLAILWCHVVAARRTALAGHVPGTKAATMQVDGRTRQYFIHVPPGYDSKTGRLAEQLAAVLKNLLPQK
jgi:poly(3-hydroxybutyrate) depolymerase